MELRYMSPGDRADAEREDARIEGVKEHAKMMHEEALAH